MKADSPVEEKTLMIIHSYRDDLSSGIKMSFPFHHACYNLLLQLLTKTTHTTVDRDALYAAMKNMIGSYSALDLDYGISMDDLYGESLRGKEVRRPSVGSSLSQSFLTFELRFSIDGRL
jgi:hypothetical protein